ncbi:GNAT family N-acetyltransferase [Cohnella hashimotonis]|uniref:GNAT family N-acetyltransferase n=1 Tax=Cohnella hashimotonis TaxID=2826895 RepID=A0ABT6TCG4_9BACL|nr:GNAT family N-acetyltransferase [Cohnella hashimotonis]MDI4644526.1 GNAT family N-acetyltransferase [Cohnella hashimotonis]
MIFERFEEKHIEGALALWNKELGASFPMRPRLLRQNALEDSRLLLKGSWAARDSKNGTVVGFAISKMPGEDDGRFGLRRDAGWIQALLVDSSQRGSGLGSELLRLAEDAIREAGAERVALGNDLHRRLFPGIPGELAATRQWFERRGYVHREDVYDLIKSYGPDERVAMPAFGGGALARVAGPADREALTAFMARCFPGTWDLQHRDYWERGGMGREYVLLEKDGAIVGFCRINDAASPLLAQNVYWAPLFEEELGGIGPLGIDEACRGYRYGISIVQAAIHFLTARGVRRIVIDTTPFVEFYGKLGYEVWKSYAKYDKELAEA